MDKEKILVVEDEEEIREIIKIHLGEDKYQIIEAEDGEKALSLLRNKKLKGGLSGILCDIRMPKINGLECLDSIRKEAPNIPVMVITGYPDIKMAADLKRKGVREFLVKPVEKKIMQQAVERIIASGKVVEL